jgi:glycosyltransferase involved in cell wall biosynthesis
MKRQLKEECLVSVTFPIHKKHEFADLALNSILNQTHHRVEVLFLDNSLSGLRDSFDFTDKRIRYFRLSPSFGLADTLNFAIDQAQGTYLARMDYDDIALPERIAVQVEFMEEHPDVGVSGTNILIIGNAIDKNVSPGQEVRREFIHENITRNLLTKNAFFHPTVIFKLSEIRKHNLRYRSSYDSAEDLDLWCRASRVLKLANIDRALLKYRLHPNQYSRLDGVSSDYFANKARIVHAIWLIKTKRIEFFLGLKVCMKLTFKMLFLFPKKKRSSFKKFA